MYKGKRMAWAPATVNRNFNSIKDFFVYWVRDGKLTASPCAHLAHLPHDDNSRRAMTAEEFKLALAAAPEWYKPAMLFGHLTGAAPSSMEVFKWADVNFEAKEVTLKRIKGKRTKFIQPMTKALYLLLDEQRSLYPLCKQKDFVFRNESGGPLSADWCSDVGNRAIKKAGLTGVVLYGMRHGLATDLTDANVNLEVIRRIMGHSNIRTTQRYAKPKTETLGAALRLVREQSVPPECHQDDTPSPKVATGI